MENVKYTPSRYLDIIASLKWIFLGIVIFIYGFIMKNNMIQDSLQLNKPLNGWDISLSLINDMYIILFFITPLVLFISIKTIFQDFDHQVLIRLGSYKKWVYLSFRRFWKQASLLLFIWMFMSIYMIIGLPLSWHWSSFSKSDSLFNALYPIVGSFQTPIFAFFAQLILLVISFSLLHILLSLLFVATRSKNFILVCSVFVFLGGTVGFKLFPKELSYLSPSTYYSLTQFMHSFYSPIIGIGVILAFTITNFFFLLTIDINIKKFLRGISPYFPLLIYIFLTLLGIISISIKLKSSESTILDVWLLSFKGASPEAFSYSSFFYYFIVFFGFVYLATMQFSREIDIMGYYKISRFKNLKKWFWSWFYKILVNVILLLFGLTIVSIGIAVVIGIKLSFSLTVLNEPLYIIFYHFLINGFLQITFYLLCVFIISWVSKESIHGVTLISIFAALMLPIASSLVMIPVGLNSLVYLVDSSPFSITIILIVSNAIAFLIIKYLFKKNLNI